MLCLMGQNEQPFPVPTLAFAEWNFSVAQQLKLLNAFYFIDIDVDPSLFLRNETCSASWDVIS